MECENENKIIKIENHLGHKQEIKVNKNNQMISYCNNGVLEIHNNFCFLNETLEELLLPNVEKIGDCFCYYNNSIKVIEFPRVKYIGRSFFQENEVIEKLDLSNAIIIGDSFCMYNKMLKIFKVPNLLNIGCHVFHSHKVLHEKMLAFETTQQDRQELLLKKNY